jgi:AcrR family transcriptional regulator
MVRLGGYAAFVTRSGTYHHGDLRRALLRAAAESISESGPGGLSMRELARRVGVTHAAAVHHFKDKAGLLTQLATDGFTLLGEALREAHDPEDPAGSFLEVGVAYVRFALTYRAHFAVMFRPDLYHPDDPSLRAARARTAQFLHGGVGALGIGDSDDEASVAALAAWSIVHGFATLWLDGGLPIAAGTDPEVLARAVAARLA